MSEIVSEKIDLRSTFNEQLCNQHQTRHSKLYWINLRLGTYVLHSGTSVLIAYLYVDFTAVHSPSVVLNAQLDVDCRAVHWLNAALNVDFTSVH